MEQPQSRWREFRDTACPPDCLTHLQAFAQTTAAASGNAPRPYHRVSANDLQQRRRASAPLLSAADSHLDWLSTLLGETTHAVCLADAQGVLLRSIGNWPASHALGLQPGFDWSEKIMGTNGIGAAITSGQPAIVVAEAHTSPPSTARVCSAAPVRDPAGRIVGAIEISTPLEEASPDSRLLLAVHTAMVMEQAMESAARVAQAESLKLLALLSSFTAHELVSPLAALKTMLDLLSRAPLPDDAAAMAAAALRHADHLLQVVEELRILGGSHNRRLQSTNLIELVRKAISNCGLGGRTEFEAMLNPPAATVDCNPSLLTRALSNLLCNARDATTGQGRIGVRLEDAAGVVRIVIWDTGPGIPPERWPDLFEESFTTKSGGSGLGMLLAKAIVERVHGGQLRFQPNRPTGCRFELELPLAAD
jgi:signal transduction histidine kinase